MSGTSVRFCHARLRAVFGHAVNLRLIASNPASAKEINPKTGKMEFDTETNRRGFNLKQVAAVLDAAKESDTKWLYLSGLLALFTGQRASDICRMKWTDVKDLDGNLPRIILEQQKTGTTMVIPIAEELRTALKAVPAKERTDYLLPARICEAYQVGLKRMFQAPWRKLLDGVELAKLEELPVKARIEATGERGRARNAWVFHSWRHTTATHLSGADAHYLLGHRTDAETKALGTTALYRHEDLQRIKKALDGIPTKAADNVVELKAVNQ
jgi:integrase